jgi:hypothetical protein
VGPRWIAAAVAFVIGGAIAVPVVGAVSDRAEGPPAFADAATVRRDYVHDWIAWRRAPLTYEETTERDDGSHTSKETVVVSQAFPRRTVLDGALRSESVERDDAVDTEVADLRARTTGAHPSYRLSEIGDGCYRLRHLVSEPRPPWGELTDRCFDRRTELLRREVRTDSRLVITTSRVPSG